MKNITYYVYHIPGIKIGVSTEPKKRVAIQGYSNFEILEEHRDIYLVSDREKELQKQYGYPVDTIPYCKSVQNRIIGCKIVGKMNVESGHLKSISSKGGKSVSKNTQSKGGKTTCNKIHICPHCLKEGRSPSMFQWHFDRCKQKKEVI